MAARRWPAPRVLAVLLVLAGCGSPAGAPDAAPPATTLRPGPGETAAAACGPVERPPQQSGSHLIGDQEPPVPYNTTPPTSGWHVSGHVEIAVHGPNDPLSEPRQVSVLEAGGVVVAYDGLPDDQRARLEAHVADSHAGRVALTPYEALEDGQVAFTAWGVLQRCTGVDLAALDAFVAEHAAEEPDAGSHPVTTRARGTAWRPPTPPGSPT